jgi:hypothetical protein
VARVLANVARKMTAIHHSVEYANGRVMTDYVPARYIENSIYRDKRGTINVWRGRIQFGKGDNVALVRDRALENGNLRLYPSPDGTFTPIAPYQHMLKYNKSELQDLNRNNRVYMAGETSVYTESYLNTENRTEL